MGHGLLTPSYILSVIVKLKLPSFFQLLTWASQGKLVDFAGKNAIKVNKLAQLLTLSLPECLRGFCKVTLTFESMNEIL